LHGVAAVEALYDWLARTTGASGIVFPRIAMNGPVRAALSAAAAASGRETRTLDEYERAVLYPNPDIEDLWTRKSSKKALKELHRRQRRLSELGPVAFRWAVSPEEVRDATEDFLALEASGWKKQSGAFLSSPSLTAFARSATRLLAHEGKCRVATLTLAGRPMAVGLVIESGGRSFFWKIAFDEKLRAHAPGIHLLYELTRAQMARGDVDMTDGCAIANHPMIDRFWPDRIGICDLAVQLPKNRPGAFVDSCNRETLRRNLRDFAKRSLRKALGRKES
jgi:hypothetical protein